MSLRFAEPNHPVNKFTRPSNVLLILVAALWFGFLPGSSLANALDPTRSAAVHSGDFVRIPGHVLPALAKATIVPSKSETGTQLVALTLVLKRDDQPGFEHFLHGLYDPKSPNFHHFLTQQKIADDFGPSRADFDSVFRWMISKGFRVERGSVNRLTLTMRGTRADAERAFDVRIGDYVLSERSFYANDRDPALPREIASLVQAVEGLSNFAAPQRGVLQFPPIPPTPRPTPRPEPTPPPPPPPITLVCSVAQASLCSQESAVLNNACLQTKAVIACYNE